MLLNISPGDITSIFYELVIKLSYKKKLGCILLKLFTMSKERQPLPRSVHFCYHTRGHCGSNKPIRVNSETCSKPLRKCDFCLFHVCDDSSLEQNQGAFGFFMQFMEIKHLLICCYLL